MTANVDLVNLALQSFGSRTTVTAGELAANSTNEAIQANLTFANTRDSLLRMAPWDCAVKVANLTYLTSVPGTPENTSPATNLWQYGQPRPPWAYEYHYPLDCLRACWIIPATQTGFTGVPITTAVTGGASTTWLGGAISFKVAIDNFLMIGNPVFGTPGTGYAVGDIISAALLPNALAQPQGASAVFVVVTIDGAGGILTANPINPILGGLADRSGSYFYDYTGAPQVLTLTGLGSGALITSFARFTDNDQRVILTNQEFATLVYVRQVTNPNVWDPLFQDAFQNTLGGDLCIALSGNKDLANICVARANNSISEARKADGNEGLTINDPTPDWIRGRGVNWTDSISGPYSSFEWGGLLPSYG